MVSTTAPAVATLAALRAAHPHIPVLRAKRVEEAFALATAWYGDALHWSGVPVLEHCCAVLHTLLPLKPDDDAVIACLLHHAVDAKHVTLLELEERFGTSVRAIVAGEYLLYQLLSRPRRMSLHSLRRMMVRASDDVRALIIFLCDRVVALGHVDRLSESERRIAARVALKVLAPMAASLGVYLLKHQLEAQAFPLAYPSDAERIVEQQRAVQERFRNFLPQAAKAVAKALEQHGVRATVEYREKQPYSAFTKMSRKGVLKLTSVYDLFALRVIVEREEDCYVALGVLHRFSHPVSHRFKDYIAFPKPNGYRSLHTTLTGLPKAPPEVFVEVQIRTATMHEEAEFGIAAHWNYKEGGSTEHALQRFRLMQQVEKSDDLFGENMGRDVDSIFVLTPKGDVIELPEGATPLDFAFQVHTDIGLAYRAARVNGGVVALNHTLENGDIVEVLRASNPHPSPRWMKLLRTASARSRLRRYLQERDGAEPEAAPVTPHVQPRRPATRKREARPLFLRSAGKGIDVQLPLQPAQCCKPERHPGADVIGIVGRGVVRVHAAACKHARTANPERRIHVHWSE